MDQEFGTPESGNTRRSFLRKTAGLAVGATALPLLTTGAAHAADSNVADPNTTDVFGPVTVNPGDPRYGELITGDNQRWTGSPDYIQIVGSTQQVINAVSAAVSAGKRLAVRSGGHCYEDFVANSDVRVIIDMSGMNAVYYDPAMKAFAIEPGARLLDIYDTLYKGYGVTIPAGRCYSVGAGGHICGGSDGLMSRRLGMTVDHLYAVEVVVVNGSGNVSCVVATRDSSDPNNDLWWAHTGGGGGNFGVVTRYWMRSPGVTGADPTSALPSPPASVLLNGISWSWADLTQAEFTTLVQNFGTWHEQNSAPGSAGVALVSSLALNHVSSGSVSMFTQVEASAPGAQQLLTDFVNAVSSGVTASARPITSNAAEYGAMPHLVNAQQLPWFHAVRYLATNAPVLTNPTLRAEHKSAYHNQSFTSTQLATIYSYLTSTSISNPNAMLLLLPTGGNVNAVDPAATAFPHRSSVIQALYQSFWSAASDDATNVSWVRDFYSAAYAGSGGVPVPGASTDGCYVNYPDVDLSDPTYNSSSAAWHDLYYKGNYPRLQQVKAKWDPKNIFNHTQSIELPA